MSEENKNELTIEEEEVSVSDSSNDSNIVDDLPLVTIDNENDNVSSPSDIQLDYLNPKLFEDIRTVDINDLISSADESSVKDEVKEQYLGSISDIYENTVPQIGDQIDVYLEYLEDRNGNLVLSKEKADFMRNWKEIRKYYDTGEIFSCKIVKRIKGGMIVDINGLPGFLPGSQIDVRPIKDLSLIHI